MRRILLFVVVGLLLLPGRAVFAQSEKEGGTEAKKLVPAQPVKGDQLALSKRRDAKLAEPWLAANEWITDYDEARAKARETGKRIFAYFTRSYAP